MNSIIIIIGFVLGIFLLTPISATTFSVDKSTYENGDIIVLSGFVAPVEAGQFVSVQILNPSQSDLVQIDTFTPNSDGSFSRNYKAEGPRWNMDGFYILKIFYNGESFQTTFEFNMNPPSQPEPEPEPEPTVTQLAILADEKGYMLNGAAITTLSFVQGEQVEITFSYDDADIYFSGLDIEATNSAFPPQKYTKGSGATNTVTFTAQESFHIKAYWPATRNLKATLQVNVA